MNHAGKSSLGFTVILLAFALAGTILILILSDRSNLQQLQIIESQVSQIERYLEKIPAGSEKGSDISAELLGVREEIDELIAKERRKNRPYWWSAIFQSASFLYVLILYFRRSRTSKASPEADDQTATP